MHTHMYTNVLVEVAVGIVRVSCTEVVDVCVCVCVCVSVCMSCV